MFQRAWLGVAVAVLWCASQGLGQENRPIPGIGPVGEVMKIKDGFRFTEGPAVDREGNVFFTDVPGNVIYRVTPEGECTPFLQDSQGCNGLMFDGKGRLIACQGGEGRIIAIDPKTKEITVLADKFQGKRFNRPNDLVVDRQGGVYFTDPMFGGEPVQDKMAVYYVGPSKEIVRLIDDLQRPNGIILSPDERTLYVLPSGSAELAAYPITAPGKIGAKRTLCMLEQPSGAQGRGGDGLTIDTKGNLYLTVPALNAIQVVSPEGKTLGMIKFPASPSNCAFGGKDMKTLYVTANDRAGGQTGGALYAVKMEATGHRFGGSH